MSAWNDYFHAPYGAARAFLLSKLLLGMLALDAWMLMIGHAGRYGAGGFNVAHFDWLDRLQPMPTAELYLGVLVLTGMLSLWQMFAGATPRATLLLCALYTYSWAMSMLDSYQHHYFVSLLLLCLAFFPRVTAQELLDAGARPLRRAGFGLPLLGVLLAILYVYTAIAKIEDTWLAGYTIQSIPSAKAGFAGMMRYAGRWGIEEARFWSLFATAVIPQELCIGAAYLVTLRRDVAPRTWLGLLSAVAFVLVLGLHLGAEHMGLEIGWFSYYMLALGTALLLPLPLVARLALPIVWPAAWLDRQLRAWEREHAEPALLLGLSLAGAITLAGVGHMLDLPGALPAMVIAAAALVLATLVALLRPGYPDPRRNLLTSTLAAIVMWAVIAASPVRWEFYRFNGGDYFRRGLLRESLDAYERSERYAPEGESRRDKIESIKRTLARGGQ